MANWRSGRDIEFDEERHGQAHIYNVVEKQPLSATNEQAVAEWKEMCKKFEAENSKPVETELWGKADPMNGHAKSQTVVNCTIRIPKSEESITIPMWTAAKCSDMIEALRQKYACSTNISFFYKQGCNYRTLLLNDQMLQNVWVKGLKTFKRQPHGPIQHPFLIIGAGHIGLRMCMDFLFRRNYTNFLCVDRISIVGGTSWQFQANSTSKLQTEFGVYHLDYDLDYELPKYFKTPWPSRDDLLRMFHDVSERLGILPYISLNTNVLSMEVVKKQFHSGPKCCNVDHYNMTMQKTEGNNWAKKKGKPWDMQVQGVSLFPGNLTLPRRETYKGEESFGGQIEYGMFGDANYADCTGNNVALVGHGAFAVENVRTCCEFHCAKIYLICRRKNIACPRVSSWFANRSFNPLSAKNFLDHINVCYKQIGWDVWDYYAVKANAERTTASIEQKVRFAIGDIYFLAVYFGKVEVCVEPDGPIKRLGPREIVLESGRHLTDIHCILKLLGFLGAPDNDILMKCKTLVGFWAEGDPRRYLLAEPVSVMASNFGATSLSPGSIAWAQTGTYFMLYPEDMQQILDANMLPKHSSDDSDRGTYRPAYVVDARHGTTSSMAVVIHCPRVGEESVDFSFIKANRQRLCHPIKQFIAEAKADWDHYGKMFLDEGYGKDKPYPEYPHTVESTREWCIKHMKDTKEPMLASDLEDLGLDQMSEEEIKKIFT